MSRRRNLDSEEKEKTEKRHPGDARARQTDTEGEQNLQNERKIKSPKAKCG